MDILLIKGAEILMGIEQKEYFTVPLRKGTELVLDGQGETREVPTVTAAFKPTPEELEKLNAGASLHLKVLGTSWAPMQLTVQEPPADPANPEDVAFEQGDTDPPPNILLPGQFVPAMVAGHLTVMERADPCPFQPADIVLSIGALSAPLSLADFNNYILRAIRNGVTYLTTVVARPNGDKFDTVSFDLPIVTDSKPN